MTAVSVYITAETMEEAEMLAEALIEERLAACVNILPEIRSVYRWQGGIERDTEVALIVKSQQTLVERLTKRVTDLHSYDVPCVVAWPILDGQPDYLNWVAAETTDA